MTLFWTVGIVVVVLAAVALGRAVRLWWRYRGDRVIECPENHRPAGVQVNATHAATRPFAKIPHLQLGSCSRWPEHAGCGQECLSQVAAAPADCLVRNILIHWYLGKRCASCGQPFGEIPLAGAKPAVLCADKVSVEWSDIPADRLAETLASAEPICFACHLGNMLRRTHPELVIDRHRRAG